MNLQKKLALSALFISLIIISTTILKIPTPPLGYIHLGDFFVLTCGIFLGPVYGGIAAGIGSMLADFLSGYIAYAPGSFFIKALSAVIASKIFYSHLNTSLKVKVLISSICAEFEMIAGYFLFDALITLINLNAINYKNLLASISAASINILFNAVQAIFAVILSIMLIPRIIIYFKQTY